MRISDWSSDVCSSDLRSVCRAEKRLCWARMLRVRGLIHPTSAVCATTDTARGEKRLPSEQNQAILKSSGGPMGECRMGTVRILIECGRSGEGRIGEEWGSEVKYRWERLH